MRSPVAFLGLAIALGLGACASVHNLPLNTPSATPFAGLTGSAAAAVAADQRERGEADDILIGLAFSGGGTRAAAFSSGVPDQLAPTPLPKARRGGNLLDHVGVITGVAGGAQQTPP
jgi:hypothetical protein